VVGGERYIVFVPAVGEVEPHGLLLPTSHVLDLLRRIAAIASESIPPQPNPRAPRPCPGGTT
jgi:hypothetical protein